MTAESTSRSFAETILIDEDASGLAELVFCYSNNPRASVQARSTQHFGACVLLFSKSEGMRLSGYYWTYRTPVPTTGELVFEFVSAETRDALPEDIQPHPMNQTP